VETESSREENEFRWYFAVHYVVGHQIMTSDTALL